jgi:hypothetical protein
MLNCKKSCALKTAIFALVLIVSVAWAASAFGQIGPGVKANFGVEGDLQADMTQFGGLGVGIGTDDWFDYQPGVGVGVIDTTGGGAYRALIQAGGAAANVTFVRRMAFPKSTVVNGYFLFDAVYARDNHSAQGNRDSSVFTATQEKNIDNPITWNLGIKSTPQKNDIVDAVAHIRRDGPDTDDTLWLFVGSSTITADGNAHNDYEFFRQADTLFPGDPHLTGTGPDSGHTAWKVDGGNLLPGDLIFSVDFENGGTNPIPTIRIWIRDGDQAAISAANPLIVFTGVFNGAGELAGPFGYAELLLPPGVAYARVNGLKTDPQPWSTPAAPWGSLEGSNAAFHDSVLALQFAEAGINLSALGLDVSTTGDPCVDLFGYVLFKTRSSASFVAELKDYVGPYPFGQVLDVVLDLDSTDVTCYGYSDGDVTATFSGGIPPYRIRIDGDAWVDPVTSPYTFNGLAVGSYTVIVEDDVGCADTTSINVGQPPLLELSLQKTDPSCYGYSDGDITATFSGGTPPYQIEIDGGGFVPATSPKLFSGLASGLHTVTVKDEHDCDSTLQITLVDPPQMELGLTGTDPLCYESCDGEVTATFGGGTGVVQIKLDAGPFETHASPHTFTGLCAGTYTVTVKDEHDCDSTLQITLVDPPELTCTVSPAETTVCAGDEAQFCVFPNGGTPPYDFYWDGPGFTSQDSCITVGDAGTYVVTVVDAHYCSTECEGTLIVESCGGCTFTMGGWGAPCPESQAGDRYSTQPGCVRDHYFSQVFPHGVWIGNPAALPPAGAGATGTQADAQLLGNPGIMDQTGVESMAEPAGVAGADLEVIAPTKAPSSFLTNGWYWALWTNASNVESFLPPQHSSGGPGYFAQNWTNPETTTAHVLAGQLLALRMNVEYSCAGIFDSVGLVLGTYCYGGFAIESDCGTDKFTGMTVNKFLAIADSAVGGLDVLGNYGRL